MKDDEIKIGDVVYLPINKEILMMISSLHNQNMKGTEYADCVWFDANKHLQKTSIMLKTLKLYLGDINEND